VLLQADPDLGQSLPPSKLCDAKRAAFAPIHVVTRGTWRPPASANEWLGAFVVRGLLTCQIRVAGCRSLELVGAGDLLCAPRAAHRWGLVPFEERWRVAEVSELAILDSGFLERIGGFPELVRELIARATERTQPLALRLAIAQIRRLDLRLLVLMWHLAERFGTAEVGGVVLPLRLSHEMLAELACARRSSITRTLHELAEHRLVTPRVEGGWKLHGEPPVEMWKLLADPRASERLPGKPVTQVTDSARLVTRGT
jgi:CRP/FNR family transcriptional regulator, cyclic AMP receptor protein